MIGSRPRFVVRWLAAAVAALAVALPASALNVQPVIIDLLASGRQSSAIVTLQNTFTTSVPIEMTVRAAEIVNDEFQEIDGEVEDILVFPAQAIVEPGQSQAFRVQWVGDPEPDRSRHYFVSAVQLPVQLPENENAIQVLYNFRIMVSVSAPSARADLQVRSAEVAVQENRATPVLEVHNAGAAHGYVGRHRMTIVQRDNGQELFRQTFEPDEIQRVMGLGLLPSDATRRLPVNVTLPSATGRLEVTLMPVEGR